MIPSILLVGAGRMGRALFAGWAQRGLAASVLVDPARPDWARPMDVVVAHAGEVPADFVPSAVVLAIKPQMAGEVVPLLRVPAGAVVLSILAGTPIERLTALLHGHAGIVRAMPNTPAAIGRGFTVAAAGASVTAEGRALCTRLLEAVGDVAWVDEGLIDPITSVSGCGPAYVFLLAEILEQVGIEQGIPAALARALARRTISGAGALMDASDESSAALRQAVTSPKGVTERALAVLMAEDAWPASIRAALAAAVARAAELALLAG